MDSIKSPSTVTVRRNPPRRARPTPYSAAPPPPPSSTTKPPSSVIRSFPIDDILSITIPHKPDPQPDPADHSDPEKLKVFLRIRPVVIAAAVHQKKIGCQKNVWPQKKKEASKTVGKNAKKKVETCLRVNDARSVTLCAPQSVTDARRVKSEVYEGFSHVFGDESEQGEVYEKMMSPLVVDFLKGKSGMLAAMGPSGSGKTHTVFGSTRQPGMVSLALRHIFSEKESCKYKCSRTFYLSMFEIYSEGGKGEKVMDLSQDGGDLYMQQSSFKGLKEEVFRDVQHAESLIASGMLKRSTAMTNSNLQSSRSQCIINIRCDLHNLDEDKLCTSVLTIVDLAGSEREKRTGNQGARLLESNFINNTSMVFGLCLRSLLEHQKNPKKPLHKNFQNSMLTKYLRDFLEGKKRMALILTVKPGEEDYQDASYLLRQASPFMNIKFENIEEQPVGNKRRPQTLSKAEQAKRQKPNNNEVCLDDEVKGSIVHQPYTEEIIPVPDKKVETSVNVKVKKSKPTKENITDDAAKKDREYEILLNFSRATWKVLKEYKNKLQANENEAESLRLKLTAEKEKSAELEAELNIMKASCSCWKLPLAEGSDKINSNAQAFSPSIDLECIKKDQITADTVTSSVLLHPDCSNTVNLENQVDEPLSCSTHCEEHVHTSVVCSINDTSSVEVASTLLDVQSFQEQSKAKDYAPCEYVLFDKEDLTELGDTELSSDITGHDTLQSGVDDLELLLHGDQKKPGDEESKAQNLSCVLSYSESSQKYDILDDNDIVTVDRENDHEINSDEVELKFDDLEKFEEQSTEVIVDHEIISVEVKLKSSDPEKCEEQSTEVFQIVEDIEEQVFKEIEERGTNGEISGSDDLESAVCDSELHLNAEKSPFVKGDDQEDSKAHISSSNSSESRCSEKQDILNDTGSNLVEVVSISSDASESQCPEKQDILDDTGSSYVEAVSISSDDPGKIEDQSKEEIDASSPIVACDNQELKEVEERDTNGEVTVADDVPYSVEEVQPKEEKKEEAQDIKPLLPESVINSQSCNYSKLPVLPSVQPSKPFSAAKPKRTLRPASSVMLKNISVSDFDDATEMPKQRNGKKGENEEGRKITQGSISLLRILKQNLRH